MKFIKNIVIKVNLKLPTQTRLNAMPMLVEKET